MEVAHPNSRNGDSSLVSKPGGTKAKNDAKWETFRSFVHGIYVKDKKTLEETRDAVLKKYSFKAG
jgi:hypothetical protein